VALQLTLAGWAALELGLRVRERLQGRGGTARDRATRVLIAVTLGAAIAVAAVTAARATAPRIADPCDQPSPPGAAVRTTLASVEDVDPLEHACGVCEVNRHATRPPALARAVQQRGTHIVLDSGEHRALGHTRNANRNPRRDEMHRRVEPHLLARRAQFDGQPARAEQASHFGGEVAIAARGVVNNDLGVRDSVDTGRLPRPHCSPIGTCA
jgi:hypothetical protein